MQAFVHVQACVRVCVCACVSVCVCVCVHRALHVCVCMYMKKGILYVYVRMHGWCASRVCVCVYVGATRRIHRMRMICHAMTYIAIHHNPSQYNTSFTSLLQNIVSLIGLFCKRDPSQYITNHHSTILHITLQYNISHHIT